MTSKEFNMFLALIGSMLKDGKTEEVLRIIEEARDEGKSKKED